MKHVADYLTIQEEVQSWLGGAMLTGFRHFSSFTLQFEWQRPDPYTELRPQQPGAFGLQIWSNWWFGDRKEWNCSIQRRYKKLLLTRPNYLLENVEDACRAYRLTLVQLLTISKADLQPTGDLCLVFSNGEEISVPGRTDACEDSWALSIAGTDGLGDGWWIGCSEFGEIGANLPVDDDEAIRFFENPEIINRLGR